MVVLTALVVVPCAWGMAGWKRDRSNKPSQ